MELLVHLRRVVACHGEDLIAESLKQGAQVVIVGAGQHGGVGDLVAVEVQDRQHRAVARGVDEVDALPRAHEGAGLRLAVAHHGGHDEVGVVEGRAESVH
jgi:hypothetical protein